MDVKKFLIFVLVVFVVISLSFTYFCFEDGKSYDGSLTVGCPFVYYSVSSGFGSPVQIDFMLPNALKDFGIYLFISGIIGFVVAKYFKR